MGLFDQYQFDPNSYDGGGLLAQLRAQLQNNQPSPLDTAQWPAGPVNGPDSPTSYASVGGYQMPVFGQAPQQDQATIPANAQPAQFVPQPPPQQATQPSFLGPQNPGMGDRLSAALSGFGSGGRSGGFLGALNGGFSGALSGQSSDPRAIAQQNLKAQYESLVPMLGPQKAMLAVMNPEAGKTLLQEALTNKEEWGQTGEDAFGNKQFGFINKRNQTINGQPLNTQGNTSGQTGGSFLAPGVSQMDSTLTGKDYLNQFSPEVKAAVQDFVDGKSMPTGNPRKGFTQAVKMIAQKYGQDIGQPVDDASYSARRTMRTQLSSSAPSSLGGQINIGNTAAAHLSDLTEKALALGNKDIGWTWGSHAINNMRGMRTDQAAKMEALKGAAQHYGQEITKFYAGSPGGVAERDRFLETINGAKTPQELAAVLATEAELMHGRLNTLGDQIKGVLGESGSAQYPVVRPESEAAFKKIAENVSKLKGVSAPSLGAGPVTVPLEVGKSTTLNGVTIRRVN